MAQKIIDRLEIFWAENIAWAIKLYNLSCSDSQGTSKQSFVLKMGHSRPLFIYFRSLANKKVQFLNWNYCENIHLVTCAGIRTLYLSNTNLRHTFAFSILQFFLGVNYNISFGHYQNILVSESSEVLGQKCFCRNLRKRRGGGAILAKKLNPKEIFFCHCGFLSLAAATILTCRSSTLQVRPSRLENTYLVTLQGKV